MMLSWRWRVLLLVCLQFVWCFQCSDCRRHQRRHRRQQQPQQQQQQHDRRYNRIDVPTTTAKPDSQLGEGM